MMTSYEKIRRSQTKKAIVASAPSVGISVVDPFDVGGLVLLGERDGKRVVWLEADGLWHEVGD